jgi:peptide/nickel transport system ATP-binding protein
LADRVCVLYLGNIVEIGSAREVLSRPLHPYSVALRSAVPQPDPRSGRKRIILPGDPPSALSRPSGCSFHPRCPIASERCRSEQPELLQIASDRMVACHFPGEIRQPS